VVDGVVVSTRERPWWRYAGQALGATLVLQPWFVLRRGDAGFDVLWLVPVGLAIVAAFTDLGPDRVEVERHAVVVRGGGRRRRPWTTRFERGEVLEARVDGWWLRIERTDGERLRYWLQSHDRAAIAAALEEWEPGRRR
jgi:hypothetical protein